MSNLPVNTDICQAAVELSPAHRANFNQRRRRVAAQRLRQCSGLSWGTSETLNYHVTDTAMTCMGAFILFLFFQSLFHKRRRHESTHQPASRYVSHSAATHYKIAGRANERQEHALETQISCFKLWCIVLYYLVWRRCKKELIHVAIYHFDHCKLVYIMVAFSTYHHLPFLRVSAVVIFLWLFVSGDVELNPGPKGGENHEITLKDKFVK